MRSPIYRGGIALLLLGIAAGCTPEGEMPRRTEGTVLVFKHGKIEGDPAALRDLLDRFEREHPGVRVVDESLPSSTDQQHQYYITNLEGGSDEFDLFALDVIWVPEFSRAGWLREITPLLPEAERDEFFPASLQAAMLGEKLFAIPWYIDAGLLYYRKDLLKRHGFDRPERWEELALISRTILEKENDPRLTGFVWQGKQYEGLVCNVLEQIWSRGGDVLEGGRISLDGPASREALRFMRELVASGGISPPLVTTADEEATRRIFGEGRAIFMRNWPYAWELFQSEGSPVRGKVAVSPLPSAPGHPPAATLGGWLLGVNRRSRHPEAAERLVGWLTSTEAQRALALRIGYKPTRMPLYRDRELLARDPFLADLDPIFRTARPRPVTPYYLMFSQIMQPEFSAAITGVKEPAEALRSAGLQMGRLLE